MKCYVGTDMLDVARIKKSMKNPTFADRVFTKKEQSYYLTKGRKEAQTAAGIFCAKEACIKAVYNIVHPSAFTDIEILHKKSGRPYIKFHGRLEQLNELTRTDVSITHTDSLASATVILYKRPEKKPHTAEDLNV